MIIVLASASGSPGVSTSVTGLALAWPRPVLVVEADPTGASAMLTGYMQQYAPQGIPGLMDLAVQHSQTGQLPDLMATSVQVPNSQIRLISGIRNHRHSASIQALWAPFLDALQTMSQAGVDVLIDLGRLGLSGTPTRVIDAADLVLLTTRSTIPALVPANNWARDLEQRLGRDSGRLGLLVIAPGRPESTTSIEKALKLPVVATLPMDPTAAEVFSNGAKPERRFERSPLYRSLPPAVGAIQTHCRNAQRMLLGEEDGEIRP